EYCVSTFVRKRHQQPRYVFGVVLEVGVEYHAYVSRCSGYRAPNGGALARVAIVSYQDHTIVFRAQPLQNFPGVVIAAIVNHDDSHSGDQTIPDAEQTP